MTYFWNCKIFFAKIFTKIFITVLFDFYLDFFNFATDTAHPIL